MILELTVLYFDNTLAKVVYFDIITTSKQNNEREKVMISQYEKEMLTALYRSLDFMKCNDLPFDEVVAAINKIESKIND